MNGNDRVTHFVADTTWGQLPSQVQHTARVAMLDTLGAALIGTLTPVSRIAAEYAAERWPGSEATILLRGRRASAVGAAFANGYSANGIDIDDCAMYTMGHPGAQVIPTALALAETHGLSGPRMLTGVVVGYEVAHRAARIWHATHEVYQACGSWGSVACAAVAAHLMDLSPEQTWHALGIADYHAPNLPMMRDIDDPAMVKHGIGWGAMNGIVAAELAARGFSGIPSLFGLTDYQNWVADIGEHYIVADGLARKRYACCAWDHAAILAADRLMGTYGFGASDIARIRVETFHETLRLGVELPTTTEEAQFSLAWPLASYIVDGEIGPDQILEQAFEREDIRSLAQRIEVVETEELNRLYRLASEGDPRGKYASKVVIELRDGRTLQTDYVEGEINYPQGTWDEESLEAKFRWLANYVLDEDRIDTLVALIRGLETVSDVRQLTGLLA